MKKIITLFLVLSLFSFVFVAADADIDAGKALVQQKVSCSALSELQLEQIGDYYMELMHPGDQHALVESAHGGEGSEQLRLTHISIARMMYCNEGIGMMTNWGTGVGGRTMMGYGNYYGGSMMGGYGFSWIWTILVFVLLIGLILLVYMWIWKLMKAPSKR